MSWFFRHIPFRAWFLRTLQHLRFDDITVRKCYRIATLYELNMVQKVMISFPFGSSVL